MNMNLKACGLSIHIIHTAHELGSYDYEPYEFETVKIFEIGTKIFKCDWFKNI